MENRIAFRFLSLLRFVIKNATKKKEEKRAKGKFIIKNIFSGLKLFLDGSGEGSNDGSLMMLKGFSLLTLIICVVEFVQIV